MFRKPKKIDLSPRLKFSVGRGKFRSRAIKFVIFLSIIISGGLAINALKIITSSSKNTNPQVLGAEDVKSETNNGQPEIQILEYKIQKGDTLFNISQKFNISWTIIATLNNLNSPYVLTPGKTIKIPK